MRTLRLVESCGDCGEPSAALVQVGSERWCPSCVECYAVTCDLCSSTIPSDDMHGPQGETLCFACAHGPQGDCPGSC